MVILRPEPDVLRVELTWRERLSAVRRTDLTVPWPQIVSIEAVAEPYRLVRGLRAPGLSIPGRTRIGTWHSAGRKTFAVTHKGRTGVRIRLRDNNYQQLLIDTEDPAGMVDLLGARLMPEAPVDGPTERP